MSVAASFQSVRKSCTASWLWPATELGNACQAQLEDMLFRRPRLEDGFDTLLFNFALHLDRGIDIREGADNHFVEMLVDPFEYDSRETVSLKGLRQCIRIALKRHRAHLKHEARLSQRELRKGNGFFAVESCAVST